MRFHTIEDDVFEEYENLTLNVTYTDISGIEHNFFRTIVIIDRDGG